MTAPIPPRTWQHLVDVDAGLISREIFVSQKLYDLEQEQLFARAWLFVGHESQIPQPGDYMTSCMGEESVILVRDTEHAPGGIFAPRQRKCGRARRTWTRFSVSGTLVAAATRDGNCKDSQ